MTAKQTILQALNLILVACALVTTGFVVRRELFAPGTRTTAPVANGEVVQVPDWDKMKTLGHKLGQADTGITIVVFSDFECPFCENFAMETMPELEKRYPGRLDFRFRHWPLRNHHLAYPAARAAECAGAQGAFKAYHDVLFQKRDSLGLLPFTVMARRAGIRDIPAFEACNSQHDPVPTIEADIAEARRIGSRGTPTVVIGGRRIVGATDAAALAAVIDTLAAALSMKSSTGIPR